MKKFLLSTFVIVTFTGYTLHTRLDKEEASMVAPPIPVIFPSPVPTSKYKDGTYTGNIADAFYGNVQVQAIIFHGQITDVKFLDYPKDRETSIYINTQAMPYLKSEVIQTQNATVDTVSGATQTSRAFRASLQTALDKALK